jgi:hypothetical protein
MKAVLFWAVLLVGGAAHACLAGFAHRTQVRVDYNGAALTSYQVPINFNSAALVADGKLRADCADLRVLDADGITSLPIWLDGSCNVASTRVWAKVPSVPTGGKTLYLAYGSASASSISDPDALFIKYDDFSSDPRTNGKWANIITHKGTTSEFVWNPTDKALRLTTDGLNDLAGIATFTTIDPSWEDGWNLFFRFKISSATTPIGDGIGVGFFYAPYQFSTAGGTLGLLAGTGYVVEVDSTPGPNDTRAVAHVGLTRANQPTAGTPLFEVDSTLPTDKVKHSMDLFYENGRIRVRIDGSAFDTEWTIPNLSKVQRRIMFGAGTGTFMSTHEIFDVRLRKYTSSPLTTTLQAEQSCVPTQLAFSPAPSGAVVNQAIAPVIRVSVQNAAGQQLNSSAPVTLSFAANSTGALLAGTTTANAVNGLASFPGVAVDKVGTYRLSASSAGLTPATSANFSIVADAPNRLRILIEPVDGSAVEKLKPVQVAIQDSFGNTVTSSIATVTMALQPHVTNAALSGTVSVNAVGGVANFSDLSVNRAATSFVLQASSAGLPQINTVAFALSPGPAAVLVFRELPSSVGVSRPIAPIEVMLQDVLGNRVGTGSSPVTLDLGSNPAGGRLSGGGTVQSIDGLARYPSLLLDTVGLGYRLRASSPGMTAIVSGPIEVLGLDRLPPLVIDDAGRRAMVGVPYRYSATGRVRASGEGAIRFGRCEGPAGFSVQPLNGAVSWTPSEAGPVMLCVSAANAVGEHQLRFAINVEPARSTSLVASFTATPSSGPAPLTVAFDASGSSAEESAQPLRFEWSFGDHSASETGVKVNHGYLLAGGYRARLRVFDPYGHSAEHSQALSVLGAGDARPPAARIVASAVAEGEDQRVTFTCDCTEGSAAIVQLRWDVAGAITTGPSHVARLAPGRHPVLLTVVDRNGLTAIDAYEVLVKRGELQPPECRAEVSPAVGQAPLEAQWSASFSSPRGEPLRIRWTLPDGTSDDASTVKRSYLAPGWKRARVAITDAQDLTCEAAAVLTVTGEEGQLPPRLWEEALPAAECEQRYTAQVAGAGGRRWSLLSGAPPGLTIDPASGELIWTPGRAQVGLHDFTVRLENDSGLAEQPLEIAVTCSSAAFGTRCGCAGASNGPAWLLAVMLLRAVRRRG